MADDDLTSPEWSKRNVIRQLREMSPGGGAVRAQVFLDDKVGIGDLRQVIDGIVKDATFQVGDTRPVTVGKIHNLAKSFSITASPDVCERIAAMPAVKSILPSEISDIYPKPVDIKRAE